MLRILTYHRIIPAGGDTPGGPLVSATSEAFERQLAHLAKKYRVVSMGEVLDAATRGARLPENSVLITFDDGYRDFAEVAWPLLKARRLPVTVFVPTGYPDRPNQVFWWDRLYRAFLRTRCQQWTDGAGRTFSLHSQGERIDGYRSASSRIKSLAHDEAMALVDRICQELEEEHPGASDVLSWSELRRLAGEGVTLGAHTRTHPILTRLPDERLREEIVGSQEDLAHNLGRALPIFCYPDGGHDERVLKLLRREGFALAFTTADGHNDLRSADPLRLARTNITPRTTLPVFRFRLLRYAQYFDRWRHRNRQRPSLPVSRVEPAHSSPATSQGRVAYIMSRFPKITETFILDEILQQKRQGLQVEIYPLLRERQSVRHPEADALTQQAHFEPFLSRPILHANWHYLRRCPRKYLGMVAEVLGKTFGSANFFVGALGILPKAVRFACEMERTGVRHVHAHFATHPTVAALIVHRLTGIPFSFTAHGSDLHVEQRMLDRKLAAAAFAVTVSSYNQEVMLRKCGEESRSKIHVIHCGVDTGYFAPRPEPGKDGRLRLLSVGSLEEVKGHTYLVEACRILRSHGVPFECRIVGEGRLRQRLQAQIARAGLADQVVLEGALPRPEVRARLARAHVFILPSVPTPSGKREGIPVALMEAMACGLPVVSSALSGLPELVEDGVSGYLCQPRDVAAQAEALLRLSQGPELRARMGQAGRRKVVAEFDLGDNARRLAALFAGSLPGAQPQQDTQATGESLPAWKTVAIPAK